MPSSVDVTREVRARLQRYLLGMESLSAFHEWFVPATWKLRTSGAADSIIKGVELRVAEYRRGDWTEPQLRGKLEEVLSPSKPSLTAATSETDDWKANFQPFEMTPAKTS